MNDEAMNDSSAEQPTEEILETALEEQEQQEEAPQEEPQPERELNTIRLLLQCGIHESVAIKHWQQLAPMAKYDSSGRIVNTELCKAYVKQEWAEFIPTAPTPPQKRPIVTAQPVKSWY